MHDIKMNNLHFYVIFFLANLSTWCTAVTDSINTDIVNTNVERKIDATSHLVKITETVTVENTGKSNAQYYIYALAQENVHKMSFIGASIVGKDDKLKVTPTTVGNEKNKSFYKIKLPGSKLDAGKTLTLDVETVYSHALRPFPAEIVQADKQFVVYEANLYYFSPYKTVKQTTTASLPSAKIESYTKTKPVSLSDTTLTYGPYNEQPAFAEDELRVHYENNNPFLTITNMQRIIEVSHWGNIAVEEHIDMYHSGSKLKGSFSRYDYQRSEDGISSIKSFKTVLPAAATDVYYRDEIGNISTSHMKEMEDAVEVELRPRFPLFGGWKTKYYLGYNVPSYEYLYNEGDSYVLKMRFLDHVYDDQIVDQTELKIILPEGTKNIELKVPFEGVHIQKENDVFKTYLDTIGRPVIIAHKSNLVEQHIQDFELHYTFQKVMMLQEPLLVVGAFYLLFLVVIVYVRLDFSITKDEAKETRMRVASLIDDIVSALYKRSALYQSYDDAVNKFKSNKETGSFISSRKKIDADYKLLTQQITALQSQLRSQGSDVSDKISEVQKLDQQYKEQITLAIGYAEKLVSGKLGKQQYIDYETATSDKRDEIYTKIETIVTNL